MTSARNGSPTRALVLGGGGAVGVGWQTGLLIGLDEAGVDLAGADTIVGTSAGAFVGALLASGRDVSQALTSLAALGQGIGSGRLAAGDEAFLSAMRQASVTTDPRQALQAIGSAAKDASTPAEDIYLGLFGILDRIAWPTGFRCTAVDIDTGDLAVWDQRSAVPLRDAVAASCAVPMLFPTVTIEGRRYMDGGLLSRLNVTAAPPTEVLVVLSCHPLRRRLRRRRVHRGSTGPPAGRLRDRYRGTGQAELTPNRRQSVVRDRWLREPRLAEFLRWTDNRRLTAKARVHRPPRPGTTTYPD